MKKDSKFSGVLSLCLYIELHYILYLLASPNDKYDVNLDSQIIITTLYTTKCKSSILHRQVLKTSLVEDLQLCIHTVTVLNHLFTVLNFSRSPVGFRIKIC